MARHARETYLVLGREGELLRYRRGGKTERLKSVAQRLPEETFAYTHIFGQQNLSDLTSADALQKLGEAMVADPGEATAEGDVPAGYTYFGQFVFHDMTYMHVEGSNPPTNLRTPALDLDSVLPKEALSVATAVGPGVGPLAIGWTSEGLPIPEDVPREPLAAADAGLPLIEDDRNDDFLPLAQCHMILLKFFNAVAHSQGFGQGEDWWQGIRSLWVQHFQSVVLHDFLPRIIDAATYSDVMNNGRQLVLPGASQSDTWLPIEFAGAVGRFGHSMIRDAYRPWNAAIPTINVDTTRFMEFSYRNSGNLLGGHYAALPTHWVSNWLRLYDFTGNINADPLIQPMLSAKIDARLASGLDSLPHCLREDMCLGNPAQGGTFNLAVATLLRGRDLEIATAQEALAQANAVLAVPITPLSSAELAGGGGRLGDAFEDFSELLDKTPLWFYILREAEIKQGGLKLGPLGGRIVMETVHAAIATSSDSILSVAGWQPSLPSIHATHFTMPDLIAFAGDPDPLG